MARTEDQILAERLVRLYEKWTSEQHYDKARDWDTARAQAMERVIKEVRYADKVTHERTTAPALLAQCEQASKG